MELRVFLSELPRIHLQNREKGVFQRIEPSADSLCAVTFPVKVVFKTSRYIIEIHAAKAFLARPAEFPGTLPTQQGRLPRRLRRLAMT